MKDNNNLALIENLLMDGAYIQHNGVSLLLDNVGIFQVRAENRLLFESNNWEDAIESFRKHSNTESYVSMHQ